MKENLVKNFYILSFSYKNLSLEEREKFVKEGYRHILGEYLEKRVIKGYVAVETCLRIELYLDVSKEFEIFVAGDLWAGFDNKGRGSDSCAA